MSAPKKNKAKKESSISPKERRDWKSKFLETLRKTLSVSTAAKAARVSRPYCYVARREDKAFAEAWTNAEEEAIEIAEAEMYRRAVKGVKKPVFQQGEHVGDVQEYSDTLLIFMLKAHKPKVYRESVKHDLGTLKIENLEEVRKRRWSDANAAIVAVSTGQPADASNE